MASAIRLTICQWLGPIYKFSAEDIKVKPGQTIKFGDVQVFVESF